MDATKAYVAKKRFDSINKINFTAQKNKNKYGVAYDHTLPDLTSYKNRSVAKSGYDPKTYYTKTQAAQFHTRDGYIPFYDRFKGLKLKDEYQRGVGRRRKVELILILQ
jgi:hypothetical protein